MSKRILEHLSAVDANMRGLIQATGGYRFQRQLECHPFESLASAIAHQQLHANAANSILRRFAAACGNGAFPSPECVLATSVEILRASGFSFAKIASLKDLAAKTIAGIVPDRQTLVGLGDEEIIERLTQVRGIGRWTVEMLLIFQLGRTDVLPVDDFGVRNGFRMAYGLRRMPRPKSLADFGQRWAPYRSAAAWFLWRANDLKRAGKLPEPVERIRLPRKKRRRKSVAALAERASKVRKLVRKVRPVRARK